MSGTAITLREAKVLVFIKERKPTAYLGMAHGLDEDVDFVRSTTQRLVELGLVTRTKRGLVSQHS